MVSVAHVSFHVKFRDDVIILLASLHRHIRHETFNKSCQLINTELSLQNAETSEMYFRLKLMLLELKML